MKKKANIQIDLEYGLMKEAEYLENHKDIFIQAPTRDYDFISINNGVCVEYKADRYTTLRTDNFFMEKYYDLKKKKLGGPWIALENGAFLFIYHFASGEEFWFKTKDLVTILNQWIEDKDYVVRKEVPNEEWTTMGYAVNRKYLEPIQLKGNDIRRAVLTTSLYN
jgi:penicillin-binding protein-related factor A (putative recombinase)